MADHGMVWKLHKGIGITAESLILYVPIDTHFGRCVGSMSR
jgi:hypothetical protein